MLSRDTLGEFRDMVTQLNRFVSENTSRRSRTDEAMTVADWIPLVNVSETESEFFIEAELPGVQKEDIKLSIQEGVLILSGHRKQDNEQKGERYHRVERSYGTFVRSFTMPDYVDDGHLRAEFKNGVLGVHLPKSEKAKPKSIEVKVS
jgi:HSP20 family protein